MGHYRSPLTIAITLSLLLQPFGVMAQESKSSNASSPPTSIKFAYGVRDVVSTENGAFTAQVMSSSSGSPLVSESVSLSRDNEVIAAARSSNDGTVSFAGLDTGLYELQVGGSIQYVRLWHPKKAPPSAIHQLLLVKDRDVQRAQQDFCCCLLGQEPIMIGVLIAAGIAIPLAVHESGS